MIHGVAGSWTCDWKVIFIDPQKVISDSDLMDDMLIDLPFMDGMQAPLYLFTASMVMRS